MLDLIRISVVFLAIIILLRRKAPLGYVMFIACGLLGLLYRMSIPLFAQTTWRAVSDFATLDITLALIFIMCLENVMRKTGMMEKILQSLRGLVGDYRIVMAVLPAIIGVLPSPGGALFSAPLVQEASRKQKISPEQISLINYWYRHPWEYMFPLYPGVILASQVLNIPLLNMVKGQLPFALLVVLLGIPLALWGLPKVPEENMEKTNRRQLLWELFSGISPFVAVITAVFGLHLPISFSLFLVLVALMAWKRYNREKLRILWREAFSFQIVLMTVGIMVFKELLIVTGAAAALPAFLAAAGLPPAALVIILTFIMGVATGAMQAVVGITFPILLGVMGASGDLSLIALGFVSGFAGVMLSPLHLCLMLTVEALKANLGVVYRKLILPEGMLVAAALVLHWLHINFYGI